MENVQMNLLKKLFTNLIPKADKTKSEKYISYFERILNSRLHCITTNEAHIISLMLDRANSLNKNHSSLVRIQSLYTNLSTKKIIKSKWTILYLLYRLSQDQNDSSLKEPSNLIQLIYKDNNLVNNGMPVFSNDNVGVNSNKSIKDNSNYNNSLGSKVVVNDSKSNKAITEKDLINDLIFVFQGVDGHYINYNSLTNSFTLNSTINFCSNVFDIVNTLSELGWLYMKVNNYLNLYKEINANSQFLQAFTFSIQNELNEYYKLISIFKNMNSSFDVNQISTSVSSKDNDHNTGGGLSLKKLLFWTLEPLERMKWVAIACESVYSKYILLF